MTKAIAPSEGQTAELTDYKAPSGLIRRGLDDIPQALLSLPRIHRVPIDFPTIQSAVDSANEDDVIELMAGEYQENIVIKRGLTVRAGVGLVILRTRDESKPLLLVELQSGRLVVEGIFFQGKAGTFWTPQTAVKIGLGVVTLKSCQFKGWNTADDSALAFDLDLWTEYFRLYEYSSTIIVSGNFSTLELRDCQFNNSEYGVEVTEDASVTISGCSFVDLFTAIRVSGGAIASNWNSIVNVAMFAALRKNAIVESQFDTLIDMGTVIPIKWVSGGGVVTFNHATICSGTLMHTVFPGEPPVHPDPDIILKWQAPQVSIIDSVLYLERDGVIEFASGLSEWGLPQVNAWSCVNLGGRNIIWAPPSFLGPDPMFGHIENGQLHLKAESPAIGAASDGTNLGAWQGTAQ